MEINQFRSIYYYNKKWSFYVAYNFIISNHDGGVILSIRWLFNQLLTAHPTWVWPESQTHLVRIIVGHLLRHYPLLTLLNCAVIGRKTGAAVMGQLLPTGEVINDLFVKVVNIRDLLRRMSRDRSPDWTKKKKFWG